MTNSVGFQCVFVPLCTTEAKLKEKNLQVLENGQAGQGNIPTACLMVVGISEILQFRRRLTSLFLLTQISYSKTEAENLPGVT